MGTTKLVTLSEPQTAAAEAYRALRMNLAFTSLDAPLQSVVISSPAANERRSAVAANLAVVMAQAEQRVILVDADLRRPQIHDFFGVAKEPGLTTYLVSREADAAPPLVATDVAGLHILPSGAQPPNPADILNSQRMAELLATLKSQADVVILDAPPVTVAVDASVLGAQTDGLLLVVRAGHTRRDRVAQAQEMLERFRVRLLGAVFTDAPAGGLLTGY
jgi:non-specific protein-tyrosine kinase